MPPAIFHARQDRFGVTTPEMAALDYRAEPFDDGRFKQAVGRAGADRAAGGASEGEAAALRSGAVHP